MELRAFIAALTLEFGKTSLSRLWRPCSSPTGLTDTVVKRAANGRQIIPILSCQPSVNCPLCRRGQTANELPQTSQTWPVPSQDRSGRHSSRNVHSLSWREVASLPRDGNLPDG